MKRHEKRVVVFFGIGLVTIIALYVLVLMCKLLLPDENNTPQIEVVNTESLDIVSDLLVPNKYSRPQTPLNDIRGVVIHYTANPGTDAKANRDYFNNLPVINIGKDKPIYASSHFVIGLDGTIIQCIPLTEIAYASNQRNCDTISIECCHLGAGGKFNDMTYDSLVKLTAWLCKTYGIDNKQVIRHYDLTGKMCPKNYVKHKKKWKRLKKDIKAASESI